MQEMECRKRKSMVNKIIDRKKKEKKRPSARIELQFVEEK